MSIKTGFNIRDRFTVVPREWMFDVRLSWRARGLLVGLMSHDRDWEVSLGCLTAGGVEDREAVRDALVELVEHGYVRTRFEGGLELVAEKTEGWA